MSSIDYLLGTDLLGAVPSAARTTKAAATTRSIPAAATTAAASVPRAAVPAVAATKASAARVPAAAVATKASATSSAAKKTVAKKKVSPKDQKSVMSSAQRLQAVGQKMTARKANKKRKSLAKMGNKLANAGKRIAQKASTTVMGLSDAQMAAATSFDPALHEQFVAIRGALDAASSLGEAAMQVDTLVGKLDAIGQIEVGNGGQAIIDRANAFVDDFGSDPDNVYYPGAPLGQWTSTANAITADAKTWMETANTTLSASRIDAIQPGGGATPWQPSTAYAAGAQVTSNSYLYTANIPGVSGTVAPSGTGTTIADGSTQWAYAGVDPSVSSSMDAGGGGGGGGGDSSAFDDAESGGSGEEDPFDEAMQSEMEDPNAEMEAALAEAIPQEQNFEEANYDPSQEYAEEAYVSAHPDYAPEIEEAPVEEAPAEPSFKLKSELPNVPDEAWTKFVVAMRDGQQVGYVSPSNALGMFALKPRRLADLGIIKNTSSTRSPEGRMIWVGEFVAPMTSKKFLSDPAYQYKTFVKSMKDYVDKMRDKSIPMPDGGRPADMSVSGALAVLHRCGPSGLKTWNEESNRFPESIELFEKVNGIF